MSSSEHLWLLYDNIIIPLFAVCTVNYEKDLQATNCQINLDYRSYLIIFNDKDEKN